MDSVFPGFIYEPSAGGGGGISGINIRNDGTLVPGGPHTTLNFQGCEVEASNVGSETADILIKVSRSAIYAGYV